MSGLDGTGRVDDAGTVGEASGVEDAGTVDEVGEPAGPGAPEVVTGETPAEGRARPGWLVPASAGLALAVVAVIAAGAMAGDTIRSASFAVDPASASLDPGRDAVRRLRRQPPRGLIVVIDTARGRLWLERGGEVLREAACSAGSGTVLVEPGNRVWVFDTPTGERRVIEKRRNPVWIKPDWAFVEEGTLPPEDWRARRDDVSLGDYALSLGDGYLIHGTLFQSLLGQPVTHGCIRLGDEDLEYVWQTVGVGTRVYLY
ncbi:MAG: L,D-transpeptidase [Thermoanaerobaculales bacterium]|nr:L,D-transpeptidase [Thermoanaerobaculales bacterium]